MRPTTRVRYNIHIRLAPMILLVGLGNIGKEYEATRHNVGFRTLDAFQKTANAGEFLEKKKFHAFVTETVISRKKIIMVKPTTFMNNSGEAVGGLAAFYKIPPDHIWIVYDDVDLPLGNLRIRSKGKSGGHNGVQSIIQHLGHKNFIRFRLGIMSGTYERHNDTADFVLGRFTKEEETVVQEMIAETLSQLTTAIKKGLQIQTVKSAIQ